MNQQHQNTTDLRADWEQWTWEIVPEKGPFASLAFIVLVCFELSSARLIPLPEHEWKYVLPLRGMVANMTLEPGEEGRGCTARIACPPARVEDLVGFLEDAMGRATFLLESLEASDQEPAPYLREIAESVEERFPGLLHRSKEKLPAA